VVFKNKLSFLIAQYMAQYVLFVFWVLPSFGSKKNKVILFFTSYERCGAEIWAAGSCPVDELGKSLSPAARGEI
jgi:hypothetical protein